jgi:hypothetical protein
MEIFCNYFFFFNFQIRHYAHAKKCLNNVWTHQH